MSSSKFITNQDKLLSELINDILPTTESAYFLVGFFYFSWFEELYKQLVDKKIRILVWMEVELDIKNAVKEVYKYGDQQTTVNDFLTSFKEIFNKSWFFDTQKNREAIDIFLKKIADGSLEIKKTMDPNHSKVYLFEKKDELTEWGSLPWTLITWSSNLTYSGLRWRHECNVLLRDKDDYDTAKTFFDELWADAITITKWGEDDPVIKLLKEETWLKIPQPYYCFIRLLDEYFGTKFKKIQTPGAITNGQYKDLSYQVDAIKKWLKIIEEHNGVMIADVVWLWKSIIGSTLLKNINERALIICPPHLKAQWEEYGERFDLTLDIFSSGMIKDALEKCRKYPERYKVLLVDEAHRYRNADTIDYGHLHQIAQGKKVILLTATPFNNSPQDIFNLIRLFQIPKKSTIQSNTLLSYEFRDLQNAYDKIKWKLKKNEVTEAEGNLELKRISKKIKHIIHPVVVRRSRVDLNNRLKYKKDIEESGISFSKVEPPKTQEFSLGELQPLYIETISDLMDIDESELRKKNFSCSRYTTLTYLTPEAKEKYMPKFLELFSTDFALVEWRQKNMPVFITRQLVWRFESCIESFKKTLENMIQSHINLKKWVDKGIIPIIRKGTLPSEDELQEDLSHFGEFWDWEKAQNREEMDKVLEKYNWFWIDKSDLDPVFEKVFNSDLDFLLELQKKWQPVDYDPKWSFLIQEIKRMREKEPERKIIIFTQFANTATYLNTFLSQHNLRILTITGWNKNNVSIRKLRNNFDAWIPDEEQENDFDVLIATDAISEWYNLHRAGLIINYDIPYNPTVVIQRIGRINRINKRVFEKLYIYNYFPSFVWEWLIGVERISKLKVKMIWSILWSDTQILSEDEPLDSFYGRMLEEEDDSNEESWETAYENIYDGLTPEVIQAAKTIPHRSRVLRKKQTENISLITYAKRGSVNMFWAIGGPSKEVRSITDEEAFKVFEASVWEEWFSVDDQFYPLYDTLKTRLFNNTTTGAANLQVKKAIDIIDAYADQFSKEYRVYLKKVINEYDSLPDQYMRALRDINETNYQILIPVFIKEVSIEYLKSIELQARDFDELSQELIMSEQFQ